MDADWVWIAKTLREQGGDAEAFWGVCTQSSCRHVRAALHEAVELGSKVKSLLGFVRHRAAELAGRELRAAEGISTLKARLAEESKARAEESQRWQQRNDQVEAEFASLTDAEVMTCRESVLEKLDDRFRRQMAEKKLGSSRLLRGMVVARAYALGYLPRGQGPGDAASAPAPPTGP